VAVTAVLPREALESIEPEADRVVFLDVPEPFGSVGEFFEDFSQVDDAEVIEALASRAELRQRIDPGRREDLGSPW
jgi:predicted phosphoribosyltransferase